MLKNRFKEILITILLIFTSCHAFAGEKLPSYKLNVNVDIEKGYLKGTALITIADDGETSVDTHNLEIITVKLNRKSIKFIKKKINAFTLKAERGDILEIKYTLNPESKDEKKADSKFSFAFKNVISNEGIFLTNKWYPVVSGLYYYSLEASVPEDFEAISEADEIRKEEMEGIKKFSFIFTYPVDNINLVANRFKVIEERSGAVDLYAYFFPEDINLARTYLEHTKKYIALYEELIGRFPFKRFSIVENFLPTGYSMPTFTILGQDVMRLPFIVKTSLCHEILHQWFGNSVYVDYSNGNWSEGLTTYLADHLYENREGRGALYRKQILIDYEAYVGEEEEFPVKEFISRSNYRSKVIGYGKAAMIFHMLRRLIGEDKFYLSLKTLVNEYSFKKASWQNLKRVFEVVSGKDLNWFFGQWVDKKGIPYINVKNLRVKPDGIKWRLAFEILQKDDLFILDVPVTIKAENDEINRTIRVDSKKRRYEISMKERPTELTIDNEYDVFRKLPGKEIPPVIATLLGDKTKKIVTPQDNADIYSDMIEVYRKRGFDVLKEKEIKESDIKESSLVIPGINSPILKRLFGKTESSSAGFSLLVKKNPWNDDKVVAIANGVSRDDVNAASRKIFHYGKYTMVEFNDGKNIKKATERSDNGIKLNISSPVYGISISNMIDIKDIIERVSDKKIIYVGESHADYGHHMVQLEVIRALHKKGKKVAIGMEMFQRPFQKSLDKYMEGNITEKEFLKTSEYFNRWGFDYRLYRDIIEFAKEVKIPVRALNIRREIIRKVSKSGIVSLTEKEKRDIPKQLDFTDDKYRKRLMEIFNKHKNSKKRNFDYFYQAQILWDETMAQSINEFLKEHPDYQIVVLAGAGHIIFKSGIPERSFRRNGFEYATIISGELPEEGLADFVLFTDEIKLQPSPKLMVIISEKEGRVEITDFVKDSISKKAGIKKGDIILSIDDEGIEGVDDLKIFLLNKARGDKIKIKVSRKGFLSGKREKEFEVTL